MTAEPIHQVTSEPQRHRLLAAPTPDYPAHLASYGPMPRPASADLLAQVERAGLTGRGGAAFPTAVKVRAVAAADGRAVVVANGAEGEPASTKDRHLMLSAPHLVLDGLQLAALITGADQAFIYLRPDAAPAIRRALGERASAGGAGDRIAVTVIEASPGFVSGQETAVVSRLNGGPARPRFSPVRVTERGVHGRPTLVQNVETLGQLALIARDRATGSFLATLHEADDGSGPAGRSTSRVWEVPHGLPLGQLLEAAGTPRVEELQAVLIGGFHGSWVRLPDGLPAPLSAAGLAPLGAALGAGVIMPLSSQSCGLTATAQIVRYLAAESAKQCGPCTFGLPELARLMSALAAGTGDGGVVTAIRQAVGLVERRGACHHPDGTARLVRSAMICFEPDVRLHQHGRCLGRIGEPYGGSA